MMTITLPDRSGSLIGSMLWQYDYGSPGGGVWRQRMVLQNTASLLLAKKADECVDACNLLLCAHRSVADRRDLA